MIGRKKLKKIKKRIKALLSVLEIHKVRTMASFIRFVMNHSNEKHYSSFSNSEFIRKVEQGKSGKVYKQELKSTYIKKLLPKIYRKGSRKPVEDKVLFISPHAGTVPNEDFKLIYNRLKSDGKYKVSFYWLNLFNSPRSVFFHNTEEFIKDMATAKAVFVNMTNAFMGHLVVREETKVIQLWHGCGSFKKLGVSTMGMKAFNSEGTHKEYPAHNYYSTVTIASPDQSSIYEEFMAISKESGIIKATGVSRTDVFFDDSYKETAYEKLYKAIPQAKEKKVILYAPTYRGNSVPKRKAPNALDIGLMAEALSDEYILIVKHHQTIKKLPEISDLYLDKFAFDMTRGKGMSINELLVIADICITDYSSVVFEYALLERPMLFFTFDLEKYIDYRGLYFDFENDLPGPLCRTTEEMIEYITNIEERFIKQEVVDFKDKFMRSCDGHATDRILALIEE